MATTFQDKLADIQKREGLTDSQIAEKLGIHRTTWNRIKNGATEPDQKTLRSLGHTFPELALEILNYVLKGNNGHDTAVAKEVTDGQQSK